MLRREEGESIVIPSREDEAARDLLRCRSDLKRTKLQLLKFLLRHGYTKEKRLGKKKTIVVIARRLGELLWPLLRQGTDYEVRHFSGNKPVSVDDLVQQALTA